ncbi:uncharacterized protein LOC113389564 [Ctenocephalides felis]|uniref:uncharacterized protein LOC113389564 n=1 Tax=Ctenocephalides felis TaxID=7515 RepID=UPI000E6E3843|nr:uncharacterized protein LOC113389564 [Ctenocephalides felis]
MYTPVYDSDVAHFSPQGRLYQVEYAMKASEQGRTTAVGIHGPKYTVLVVMKPEGHKLATKSTPQDKLIPLDESLGGCVTGIAADSISIIKHLRLECANHRHLFGTTPNVGRIMWELGRKMQIPTQTYGKRPYGVALLLATYDENAQEPKLYHVGPSSSVFECRAYAIGKRSKKARAFLENYFQAEDLKSSNKPLGIQELLELAVEALKATLEGCEPIQAKNLAAAVVGYRQPFRLLADDHMYSLLKQQKGAEEPPAANNADESSPKKEESPPKSILLVTKKPTSPEPNLFSKDSNERDVVMDRIVAIMEERREEERLRKESFRKIMESFKSTKSSTKNAETLSNLSMLSTGVWQSFADNSDGTGTSGDGDESASNVTRNTASDLPDEETKTMSSAGTGSSTSNLESRTENFLTFMRNIVSDLPDSDVIKSNEGISSKAEESASLHITKSDTDQSEGLYTLITDAANKKAGENPDKSKGLGYTSATSTFRSDHDSTQDSSSTGFRTKALKQIRRVDDDFLDMSNKKNIGPDDTTSTSLNNKGIADILAKQQDSESDAAKINSGKTTDESKGSGAPLTTIVSSRSATSDFKTVDNSLQDCSSTSFRTNLVDDTILDLHRKTLESTKKTQKQDKTKCDKSDIGPSDQNKKSGENLDVSKGPGASLATIVGSRSATSNFKTVDDSLQDSSSTGFRTNPVADTILDLHRKTLESAKKTQKQDKTKYDKNDIGPSDQNKKSRENPDESKDSGSSQTTIVSSNSRRRSATFSSKIDDNSLQGSTSSTSFRLNPVDDTILNLHRKTLESAKKKQKQDKTKCYKKDIVPSSISLNEEVIARILALDKPRVVLRRIDIPSCRSEENSSQKTIVPGANTLTPKEPVRGTILDSRKKRDKTQSNEEDIGSFNAEDIAKNLATVERDIGPRVVLRRIDSPTCRSEKDSSQDSISPGLRAHTLTPKGPVHGTVLDSRKKEKRHKTKNEKYIGPSDQMSSTVERDMEPSDQLPSTSIHDEEFANILANQARVPGQIETLKFPCHGLRKKGMYVKRLRSFYKTAGTQTKTYGNNATTQTDFGRKQVSKTVTYSQLKHDRNKRNKKDMGASDQMLSINLDDVDISSILANQPKVLVTKNDWCHSDHDSEATFKFSQIKDSWPSSSATEGQSGQSFDDTKRHILAQADSDVILVDSFTTTTQKVSKSNTDSQPKASKTNKSTTKSAEESQRQLSITETPKTRDLKTRRKRLYSATSGITFDDDSPVDGTISNLHRKTLEETKNKDKNKSDMGDFGSICSRCFSTSLSKNFNDDDSETDFKFPQDVAREKDSYGKRLRSFSATASQTGQSVDDTRRQNQPKSDSGKKLISGGRKRCSTATTSTQSSSGRKFTTKLPKSEAQPLDKSKTNQTKSIIPRKRSQSYQPILGTPKTKNHPLLPLSPPSTRSGRKRYFSATSPKEKSSPPSSSRKLDYVIVVDDDDEDGYRIDYENVPVEQEDSPKVSGRRRGRKRKDKGGG